jgi:hypothetical protein
MPPEPFKSAYLKIERAAEHIADLNELLRKERPFSYILETDAKAGKRATFAKKNEPIIDRVALMCGDIAHNLRSALDHAYWSAVSPFAETPRDKRAIQFPFCEKRDRLQETMEKRLAHQAGAQFLAAIAEMKPYKEPGGNIILCLINELDIVDKHRLLIPVGDYTRLSGKMIRRQVPDFPQGLIDVSFGDNRRDVGWSIPPMNRAQRRTAKVPKSGILEQKLDVPVGIVFRVRSLNYSGPVIPTLHEMTDMAREVVAAMAAAVLGNPDASSHGPLS